MYVLFLGIHWRSLQCVFSFFSSTFFLKFFEIFLIFFFNCVFYVFFWFIHVRVIFMLKFSRVYFVDVVFFCYIHRFERFNTYIDKLIKYVQCGCYISYVSAISIWMFAGISRRRFFFDGILWLILEANLIFFVFSIFHTKKNILFLFCFLRCCLFYEIFWMRLLSLRLLWI